MDDEDHLAFECQRFQNSRSGPLSELIDSTPNLHTLFESGDILFYRYIADCMKMVDEGVAEEPQAQQPPQADS